MKKTICILALILLCSVTETKGEVTQNLSAEMASPTHKAWKAVNAHWSETATAELTDDEKKENFKKQNLYSPLKVNRTENTYHMNGTIFLNDRRCLTEIEAQADTDITIKGTLTRTEGDIKLLYRDVNNTVTTLIDSGESTDQPITIDQVLNIKAGRGEIYFSGSAVYDFDLDLGLSDNLAFYLN